MSMQNWKLKLRCLGYTVMEAQLFQQVSDKDKRRNQGGHREKVAETEKDMAWLAD